MNQNPRPSGSESAPNVGSPCILLCVMDREGYCAGCRRRLDEIASWGSLTDDQRRAVLSLLPGRRQAPGRSVD